MALDGTYTGLQASVADWLHRDDLGTVIPDFVALAESRIARDLRLRKQIAETTLTTVAATQSVALPTDFLEAENLSIEQAGIDINIPYVNIEHINVKYPNGGGNARPAVYTFEGDNILLGPTPDAAYSLHLYYYQRWTALSTTPTNWLLTYHPNVYLFGSLAEAADYAESEMVAKWEQKYQMAVKQLQDADDASMFSGSALRVRTV